MHFFMMRLSSTIPCGKYKHPDLPNFLNHKPLYFSSPYLKGSTLLILPTPYLQHSRIIKNAIGGVVERPVLEFFKSKTQKNS